ncbi:lipid-A-disaccharide synthase N-terminal domain-containing protein [Alistipes sp.]|uniref:lipid-A-disaccharide synthase N-terminal domain-containing protein n=1 Tax=Alistipes sp. TaxID=1872444 RepID=UPI003A841401
MGWIYVIGFTAQAFFSARILIQWILSERAHRVVSPAAYWICSLVGSWLLFLYGWLRADFAIILGQLISYYVYLGNLHLKHLYRKIPRPVRIILIATPVVALCAILGETGHFVETFLHNDSVPVWLLILGSAGQAVFSLRFVYQWIYSSRHGESVLPAGFWIMSLSGSALIVLYGVIRHDPVLILGQSVGFGAYARNLILSFRNGHETK